MKLYTIRPLVWEKFRVGGMLVYQSGIYFISVDDNGDEGGEVAFRYNDGHQFETTCHTVFDAMEFAEAHYHNRLTGPGGPLELVKEQPNAD